MLLHKYLIGSIDMETEEYGNDCNSRRLRQEVCEFKTTNVMSYLSMPTKEKKIKDSDFKAIIKISESSFFKKVIKHISFFMSVSSVMKMSSLLSEVTAAQSQNSHRCCLCQRCLLASYGKESLITLRMAMFS